MSRAPRLAAAAAGALLAAALAQALDTPPKGAVAAMDRARRDRISVGGLGVGLHD